MGQSQSARNGRNDRDRHGSLNGDAQHPVVGEQLSSGTSIGSNSLQAQSSTKHSRAKNRSISETLRRSVVGLVKPSTSHSEEDDGSRQQQKKWRRSRRWSKAPLTGLSGDSPDASPSYIPPFEGLGSSQTDENEQASSALLSAVNPPPTMTDKQTARSGDSFSLERHIPDDLPNETDTTRVASAESSATSSSYGGIPSESEAPVTIPQFSPPPLPDPVTPRAQAQEASSTTPASQFPPAGTLVVVQGVVHTSDTLAARPTSQANSRPRTPVSARRSNLLSGLLRRRNSASSLSSPPGDSAWDSASTRSAQGSGTPESVSVGDEASGETLSDPSTTPQTGSSVLALSDPSPTQTTVPGSANVQRTQSNSSLDVLGALLSVATAATAASLLSAPVSRPPPINAEANQSATGGRRNQSAISSLARALANANPAAAAALLHHDRDVDQERIRVRNLWDNLRQRLAHGRGRNHPPQLPAVPDASSVPGQERRGGEQSIPESLFSELARAFNINDLHDDMESDEPFEDQLQRVESGDLPASEEEPSLEDLASGSFERFLIDLQTDLRIALSRTEREGDSDASREPASAPPVPSVVIDAPSPPEHESVEPTAEQLPEGPPMESEIPQATPVQDMLTSDSNQRINQPLNSRESSEISSPRTTSATLPTSEYTTEPVTPADQAAALNNERRNPQSGGMSWWRTYRFPPMNLQVRPQNSTTARSMDSQNENISSEPHTQETNPPSLTDENVSTAAATDGMPERTQETHQTVVPVIVVGLQSVGGPRTQVNPSRNADTTTTTATESAATQPDTEMPASSQEGWRSRAARAFGRRPASADSTDNRREDSESGSRTFFIYVFGGYYPPNHHMVTGSGSLDSFEALWELAELLGQAKPPVASDAEIANSGLEVFKAKSRLEYEKNGQVSSNCIDRCLICLDDYEEEDDLRLLSCKHAFHQHCVDHWLKTGRNNCPACRGTGVKTGEEPQSAAGTAESTA